MVAIPLVCNARGMAGVHTPPPASMGYKNFHQTLQAEEHCGCACVIQSHIAWSTVSRATKRWRNNLLGILSPSHDRSHAIEREIQTHLYRSSLYNQKQEQQFVSSRHYQIICNTQLQCHVHMVPYTNVTQTEVHIPAHQILHSLPPFLLFAECLCHMLYYTPTMLPIQWLYSQ